MKKLIGLILVASAVLFHGAALGDEAVSNVDLEKKLNVLYGDRSARKAGERPTAEEMKVFSEAYYFVRQNPNTSLDYIQQNPDQKFVGEFLMDLIQAYREMPEGQRQAAIKRAYGMAFDAFINDENPDRLLESCRRALEWGYMNADAIDFAKRTIDSSKSDYVKANATFILADSYRRSAMTGDISKAEYHKLRKTAKDYFSQVDAKYGSLNHWVIPFYRESYAYQNDGKEMPEVTLHDKIASLLAEMDIAAVGTQALELTANNLAGDQDKLSNYKGKVVLMDFWATWCGPCVASLPAMVDFQKELNNKDFVIISLSVDADVDTVTEFIEEKQPMPWVNWHISDDGEITQPWGVNAFPTYILLDKDGVIRRKTHSFKDNLKSEIKALL